MRDEAGATSVEHALLVTAIAAVLVIVVFALGGATVELFSGSCSELESEARTGAGC